MEKLSPLMKCCKALIKRHMVEVIDYEDAEDGTVWVVIEDIDRQWWQAVWANGKVLVKRTDRCPKKSAENMKVQ